MSHRRILVPHTQAAIAQLAARRSHNPKVVSSILTGRSLQEAPRKMCLLETNPISLLFYFAIAIFPKSVLYNKYEIQFKLKWITGCLV